MALLVIKRRIPYLGPYSIEWQGKFCWR